MTEYRLASVEYVRKEDRTPLCEECGAPRGDKVIARERFRKGDIIDVTGAEEARLLAAGALAPIAEPEPEPADVAEKSGDGDDADEGTDDEESAGDAKRPRKAAPVDDWREYARLQGMNADAVENMTKAELIAAIGGGA